MSRCWLQVIQHTAVLYTVVSVPHKVPSENFQMTYFLLRQIKKGDLGRPKKFTIKKKKEARFQLIVLAPNLGKTTSLAVSRHAGT